MVVFKSFALLVRFLLELCMLGALGYWGFKTGDSAVTQVLLGLGAPLLAAVVWGLFIAPKATFEVPKAVWVGLQVVLFGAAARASAPGTSCSRGRRPWNSSRYRCGCSRA